MYCRHLAWLHAVPEKAKESRQKSIKAANEDSFLLKMPELDESEYLLPMLFEAGLVSQSGMGIAPLSWQEIQAWQNCTGVVLHTWEVCTLKQMSEAYAGEFSSASKPDAAAPYQYAAEEFVEQEIDHEAVCNKLHNAFRSLMQK